MSLLLSTSSIRSFHSWTRTLDCSSLHFVKFALAPIFALAKAAFEATRFELRGLSGSTVLFTFDDVLVVQTSYSVNKPLLISKREVYMRWFLLDILETNAFQFTLLFAFTLFSTFCFRSLSFTLPVIMLFFYINSFEQK